MARHASLSMYDWPEERARVDAQWAAVRAAALAEGPAADLPETLTRPGDRPMNDLWQDPDCVFSQTCWGPLSLGLIDHLRPLAQPDYSGLIGGRGLYYRSAVIARDGAPIPVPQGPGAGLSDDLLAGRILAFNGVDSLSGFLCLQQDLKADPRSLAADWLETGAHRASVIAVAQGHADIAAIDCQSWALALQHEPCAAGLVVVGWTSERLGLPFVTHRSTPEPIAQLLRNALKRNGCLDVPDDMTGRTE